MWFQTIEAPLPGSSEFDRAETGTTASKRDCYVVQIYVTLYGTRTQWESSCIKSLRRGLNEEQEMV